MSKVNQSRSSQVKTAFVAGNGPKSAVPEVQQWEAPQFENHATPT
jgi:hypothetical protein